ncbi:hypothetical protein VTN77DRAFT_9365 [Rasamsonia byssochlamydoides]|uniref:uncharacterized protein n=1 Tax=Rasamsonia byssochlamydoides TaxID=89139 RepID=UPI0037448AA1
MSAEVSYSLEKDHDIRINGDEPHADKETPEEDLLVTSNSSDDPESPLNWAIARKWAITLPNVHERLDDDDARPCLAEHRRPLAGPTSGSQYGFCSHRHRFPAIGAGGQSNEVIRLPLPRSYPCWDRPWINSGSLISSLIDWCWPFDYRSFTAPSFSLRSFLSPETHEQVLLHRRVMKKRK